MHFFLTLHCTEALGRKKKRQKEVTFLRSFTDQAVCSKASLRLAYFIFMILS